MQATAFCLARPNATHNIHGDIPIDHGVNVEPMRQLLTQNLSTWVHLENT